MNSLDFAINMESDGEKYYREQALLNKDNYLSVVFNALAKDENKHAAILENLAKQQGYELQDSEISAHSKNLFENLGQFRIEIKENPTQLDVYRVALEMERKSIDLYKEFLSDAKNESEIKLFTFLIKEEEKHFAILEDIVLLVNRPEEWVEFAEFGLRKEY